MQCVTGNRLILDEKMTSSYIQGHVEEGTSIQGRVRIEAGASVQKGATVRGPAHIGKETIIEAGTYVGPYTSIGNRCRLSSCEIENSIIMDGCRISATERITDSLIAPECEILGHRNRTPRGYHFVLDERSKLHL